MDETEAKTKMKRYAKLTRKSMKGSKRAKKKLRKTAENDLITFIAKKATNHPAWYTKLGGELIGLNYGGIDQLALRTDLIKGANSETIQICTTTDALVILALTATSDDTVRVAAQKIVNELRLVSGANTIYDVDDMVDYLLNIRSIWASLTQIRRAIRCLNIEDPYDIDAWRKYLYMALNDNDDAVGTPVGFSSEFRQKAATIVNWLNTIVKSVRFMMPGNFSLFERTLWLMSNIFVDGTGKKFGSKMFIAPTVPYYTHTGSTHTAVTYDIFSPAMTVATMENNVQSMISDFTNHAANIAIAGDLMKAYGMASFYDPGQIAFTEKVPFLYDERALEQIANCDILAANGATYVYQYNGVNAPLVITMGGNTMSRQQYCSRSQSHAVKFVNTSDNVIEAGETLSLTRFKASTEPAYDSSGNVTTLSVLDCGTEVVLDYTYVIGFTTVGGVEVLDAFSSVFALSSNQAYYKQFFSCWSIDDYGPICFMYNTSVTDVPGSGLWRAWPIFDFSNWALMSLTEQRQFHKTAVLSLMTPTASVVQQAVAKL